MDRYVLPLCILVFVISEIVCYAHQTQYFYVFECPAKMKSQKQRSEKLNCTWKGDTNVYHCLPTLDHTIIESCFDNVALVTKDGCPYFTIEEGAIQIRQRKCDGYYTGCLNKETGNVFYSEDAYKSPHCLVLPGYISKATESATDHSDRHELVKDERQMTHVRKTKESATVRSETYDVEKKRKTTRKLMFSEKTENSDILEDDSFFAAPILWLAIGFFLLICGVIGFVVLILFKRITVLRNRMEADSYMLSVQYGNSIMQQQEQSSTENIYDCIPEGDETDGSP